jgi:valyl-tRNA synthetase
MAGKERDPEILRAEAKELLKKAKSIEEKKFKQAGELVYEYHKKDFADFDIEQFKSQVENVFKGEKKE